MENSGAGTPRLGMSARELAWRRSGLGGSDAAAVLGVSPWTSPLEVWAEKTGELADEPPRPERWVWGLRLESALRSAYTDRYGVKVRRPPRLRHRERRWQLGHPDGITSDDEGPAILEFKTSEWGHGFGEPGTDQIPPHYKAQLWHYLDLAELRRAYLFATIGGRSPERWVVDWTPAVVAMRDELAEWWNVHVVGNVPPEPNGSDGDARAIRRRYRVDNGASLVALPHQYGPLRDLLHARSREQWYATQAERLAQVVQSAMGEAVELHAPGVRITWKTSEREVVDWRAYAESLRMYLDALTAAPGKRELWDRLSEGPDLDVVRGLYSRTETRRTFRVNVSKDTPLLTGGSTNGDDD